MKEILMRMIVFAAVAFLVTTTAFSQTAPPDRPEGRPERNDRGGDRGDRGGSDRRPPGPDMGGGQRDRIRQSLDLFRGFFDIVDRYAHMVHDPNTAGVAAVISANEILKPRGPE